jgi:hypothetical protein
MSGDQLPDYLQADKLLATLKESYERTHEKEIPAHSTRIIY